MCIISSTTGSLGLLDAEDVQSIIGITGNGTETQRRTSAARCLRSVRSSGQHHTLIGLGMNALMAALTNQGCLMKPTFCRFPRTRRTTPTELST